MPAWVRTVFAEARILPARVFHLGRLASLAARETGNRPAAGVSMALSRGDTLSPLSLWQRRAISTLNGGTGDCR